MVLMRSLILICLISVFCKGDDYHWGSCPKVTAVPNFNFEKFSGVWYVIEKIDAGNQASCWSYYFYNNNGTHKIIQTRNRIVDPLLPQATPGVVGTLTTPNESDPGWMTASFSDNIAGKSQYVVYYTDYDNYAAIFKCQKIAVGNRQTAVILSRKPTLHPEFTSAARGLLMGFHVDIHDFQRIDHSLCVYTSGYNGPTSNMTFGMESEF